MPLKFTRRLISTETFESAGVFDVDGDGILDIVSGCFWYRGPTFQQRYFLGPVTRHDEYFDDFSTIAMDIDGDGRLDFVTGGWWGNTLRWRQNPADPTKPWPEHIIDQTGNIETTRAWDVDGDGHLEIVPNTPNGPLAFYRLNRDAAGRPTGQFTRHLVLDRKQGHGLGFGDIDGDGLGEFILGKGIVKRPASGQGPWTLLEEFDIGPDASVPVLVADVNADGLPDLIVGRAHSYGLDWYQQQRSPDGRRTWIRHPIDPFNSQYHDLAWVDLDGDGQCELVTGKRYRAHCDRDPGAFDDIGIYYLKWTGEGFAKQVIAYGPAGHGGAGLGIHFQLADLRGTGRLDIIAPGKDGLQVFYNEGL